MRREVVSVHVGQCGMQVGEQCWRLFAQEHGLLPPQHQPPTPDHPLHSFFAEGSNGQHVARAVFVDVDRSAVDGLRAGRSRGLFRPEDLVSGNDGTGGVFARGFYSHGDDLARLVMERVRHVANECDGLQGFMVYHGTGGGTGSGLAARLLELLVPDYPRVPTLSVSTFPSPSTTTPTVEPYNAVLATHSLLEYNDVDFVFENGGLVDLCRRNLALDTPTHANLNHLVAQAVSSVTASLRFGGHLNVDLFEFRTNLVPFPRMQFVLSAYAPIVPKGTPDVERLRVAQLATGALQPANFLARCDPRVPEHYYTAMCLMPRGDVRHADLGQQLTDLRNGPAVQFASWALPSGFKPSIATHQPLLVPEGGEMAACPRSVTNLCNNTAVSSIFHGLSSKFDALLAKRAFVHWFLGAGMEEGELLEAREDVAALEMDYQEVVEAGGEEEQ